MPVNPNTSYIQHLRRIMDSGSMVESRGMKHRELLTQVFTCDMLIPVITLKARKLNYKFMAAEAHWILSGSRLLNHHPEFTTKWAKFSDDGLTLNGAYGPPFLEQIGYVVGTINQDPGTRQAVMTLWSRNPRFSKDIPCTIGLQFLVRGGMLHTNVFMRSSDAYLGLPYDLFTFSAMSRLVKIGLWDRPELGQLTIFIGSAHIYETNFAMVDHILTSAHEEIGHNLDILTHGYDTPDELLTALESSM